MRQTRQRSDILNCLQSLAGFVTVQALHRELRNQGHHVGLTTIYRTLQELDREGRLDLVHRPSGERLYKLRPTPGHQHHLVCRRCGCNRPLDTDMIESWIVKLSHTSGFAAIHHRLELDGICPDCQRLDPF